MDYTPLTPRQHRKRAWLWAFLSVSWIINIFANRHTLALEVVCAFGEVGTIALLIRDLRRAKR